MNLHIVYRLESVRYRGEGVGNDWHFYFRTQAGLTRLDSGIRLDDTSRPLKVIGIHTAQANTELTDTWWVSVVENDFFQDDRAASSKHVVPIYVEPGVEITRTITVEVTDTGRIGQSNRAWLDFEIVAAVLNPDQPLPELEAIPQEADPDIERPTTTAGAFPDRFEAIADGVDPRSVPVVAHKVLQLERGVTPADNREERLLQFLEHFSNHHAPAHTPPSIALYRIENPDGILFWSSQNGSMGMRTQARIMDAVNEAIPAQGGGNPTFVRGKHTLVVELFGNTFAGTFGAAAAALAEVVMELTEDRPERTSINRDLYTRTSQLDWYSGMVTRAFFIEPTPFSGPDRDIWLVVWTDPWEE